MLWDVKFGNPLRVRRCKGVGAEFGSLQTPGIGDEAMKGGGEKS